ncbi:FAD-binding protein [Wukongibacter sp. M2B1]|uniref:FAD-binding protein n=1 Tax=Wukongibacter sp. M2B1 TaxID=3088895 RepID=UPI003D7B72C8
MVNVKTNRIETDILVVGHGIAGLAAVHAVKDENPDLKVLAVDKASLGYGGKANKGGGHVAFIPEGEEEKYVEYHTKNNGDYLNDQDALRNYANSTIKTLDKWEKWGGKLIGREYAFNAHPSIPWKVCLVDSDILLGMAKEAKRRGIDFIDKIDVTDLLTYDGRVTGAIGFSVLTGERYIFKSKAVILANGNQNWGIMKMWASGRGEGIAAAYRAGAMMRNAEFGSFVNIVSLDHGHVSYEAENFMYNKHGKKVDPNSADLVDAAFRNVCGGVDIGGAISMVMYSEIAAGNGPIYENHAQNDFPDSPFGQIIFPMKGEAPPEWFRPGTHKFAHRLFEKAKEAGYAKNPESDLKEVEPGVVGECSPLYADHDMASNIPGLFSCGDISANGSSWSGAVPTPPGRNRGSGLMNAVYTASVAGPSAVKYATTVSEIKISEEQIEAITKEIYAPLERYEGTTTSEIEWGIKSLLQYIPYSNYKSEDRLLEVLKEVEKLKDEVVNVVAVDWHDLAKANACKAMVLCAEMFFKGSIARKESRGWHIHEDYPNRDDKNMLKWINFQKGQDGEMVMSFTDVPMENYKYKPKGWE